MHELNIHRIFGNHCPFCWYEHKFDWYKKGYLERQNLREDKQ